MNKSYIFIAALLLLTISKTFSQTLPVGMLENLEDNVRRQQLLGNDSSGTSFMIRPLQMSTLGNLPLDPVSKLSLENFRKEIYSSTTNVSAVYLLPLAWNQQINSHHPYGWNDGSMIQAKGYQAQLSVGIYAKIGPLSIQLRPEFVYAQNADFREITETETENGLAFVDKYVSLIDNGIDLPDRIGNKSYSRMSWGQSSIRLTFDPVSIGLSNENLWWGPGIRSSLLMSNNASGFKHITINTTRPVNTPIGSFETQIIAGRLEDSGAPRPNNQMVKPKPNDWRYLSGISFTYQPRWVPNLYLGFDRSFTVYREEMGKKFGDYFPLFSTIQKQEISNGPSNEDMRKRDQYASFFAKWIMPESHSEIYFQYGRNDHPYNTRDALSEPEHSRAYIAGFRKLIPLNKTESFIQMGLELTQLEGARTGTSREQPIWYVHHQVLSGYTNKGQVLGAGIGPGSNLQSLDVNWVKGLKRIGFQVERLVKNNDLYYDAVKDLRRHWIDLSFSGKFDWNYKNFIFNSQLTLIHSKNYQYTAKDAVFSAGKFWNWKYQDVDNLHFKVGILYNW